MSEEHFSFDIVAAALNQADCSFSSDSGQFKRLRRKMQIIPNPLNKLKKKNAWRMTWRKVFLSVVSQRLTHALLQNSLFSFSILIHCNGAWITASTLLCVSATFF